MGTDSIAIRKVLVIYNPRSGTLLRDEDSDPEAKLRGLFQARGIEAELRAFDADALEAWIRGADEDGMDAVIACGGDGSIHAVVAALGDCRLALGVIPGGTMNILARDIGLSDDLDAAADVIAAGRVRRIDVAFVNGSPFLCHSSIGLMPHIAHRREQWRDLPGWKRWPRVIAEFFSLLRRYPRLRLSIDIDGRTRAFRTRAVAVSNNPLRDARGPIPARESLDAGKLGLYVTRDTSAWSLPRIVARILAGTWKADAGLETFIATSAVLSLDRARPLSVMNDGEPSQFQTPLRYTIRPRALRILVPESAPE